MASMQTSRADSDSNSNSTSSSSIKIPERPPVLKRSKTITDDAATAHFPGPLFPAVRRVATSPSQFERGVESSTTSSSATSGGSSFSDHTFNLADRYYVYPSFLGPYATRSRATVKSPSRSPVTEPTLSRNASLPSNLTVDVSRPKLESVRKIGAAIPPRPGKLKHDARPKMAKLKGEMELNSLSLQVQTNSSSSGASNSSSNSYSARKSQGFGSSWTVNLAFIFQDHPYCAM